MTDDLASRIDALEKQLAYLEGKYNTDMVALCERIEALETKRGKKGSRLPEDWQPDYDEKKYAGQLGLSYDDIVKAVGSFKAYWCDKTGPNATKLSWTRTWQEWCRKDAERLGKSPRDDACGRDAAQVQSEVLVDACPIQADLALRRLIPDITREGINDLWQALPRNQNRTALIINSFSPWQLEGRSIILEKAQALGYKREDLRWPT